MYQKNFDEWNNKKKIINKKIFQKNKNSFLDFHDRELWWGSVGVNVGSEQDGIGENFERPILVLKKLSLFTFLGVPLSTKEKLKNFQVEINFKKIKNYALLDQVKVFDIKRLDRKIGKVAEKEFQEVRVKLKSLI